MDMSQLEAVQSFRAATMREALDQVRRSLGEDAVIVETRRVAEQSPRRGWRRGETVELVEVTAGREPAIVDEEILVGGSIPKPSRTAPNRPAQSRTVPAGNDEPRNQSDEALDTVIYEQPSPRPATPARRPQANNAPQIAAPRPSVPNNRFDDQHSTPLAERLAAIEDALRSLTRDRRGHGPLIDRLTGRGIPIGLARSIVHDAAAVDPMTPPNTEELVAVAAAMIRTQPVPRIRPGEQRRIALIGPTGVGKTTTIAKLAARYRLQEKLSVGLVTVDDYRVAAEDQLRTYADLLQCPIRVVADDDQMRRAMTDLESCDVVLIDTAGLGRPDEHQLATLDRRLSIAGVHDRYFVISVCNTLASTRAAAERYSPLRPTAAIYTKLDETPEPGIVIGIANEVTLPARYVTNGQEVPRDLEIADAARLAREIVAPETV